MTKLSEQQKNVIKSMCKQMLDLIQKKTNGFGCYNFEKRCSSNDCNYWLRR